MQDAILPHGPLHISPISPAPTKLSLTSSAPERFSLESLPQFRKETDLMSLILGCLNLISTSPGVGSWIGTFEISIPTVVRENSRRRTGRINLRRDTDLIAIAERLITVPMAGRDGEGGAEVVILITSRPFWRPLSGLMGFNSRSIRSGRGAGLPL